MESGKRKKKEGQDAHHDKCHNRYRDGTTNQKIKFVKK